MRALWVFVVVLGCGGKEEASVPPSGSAVAAKGSAAGSAAGSATPPVAKTKGALRREKNEDLKELTVIFDGRIPVLPAISSDGTRLATFGGTASMPMFPMTYTFQIARVDGTGKAEQIVLIDDKLSNEEGERTKDSDPMSSPWKPPAAVLAKLRNSGTAVEARLRDGGFVSLDHLDVADDNLGAKPFKIGALTLAAVRTGDDNHLDVTLTDAANKPVHKQTFDSYQTKECPPGFMGGCCNYSPLFSDAYLDPAKRTLYVFVRHRFNDECTMQEPKIVAWAIPESAPPSPDETALATLLAGQISPNQIPDAETTFTADAQLIAGTTIAGRDQSPWIIKTSSQIYSTHEDANVQVVLARDGKSAWASLTTTIGLDEKNDPHGQDAPWRVSSVMAKTAAGWRIVASTWTEAITDAVSEKAAKTGKRTAGAFTTPGDNELREAFAKLVSAGVDADAAKRSDLVSIGTAPGERTVGGAQFAKVWGGAFKGKVTVVSSTAKRAPSGTTGWVAATLELPQTGYKLPFHAFCVFDKTAAGTWSLVHAHFSVY